MSETKFDAKKLAAFKFKAKQSLVNVLKPQKKQVPVKQQASNPVISTIKIAIFAFIAALIIRSFLVQLYYVPSMSMDPEIVAGDWTIVNKVIYGIGNPFWGASDTRTILHFFSNPLYGKAYRLSEPRNLMNIAPGPTRMDIVAFKCPEKPGYSIKRVIGMPGEQVKMRKGTVYINGNPLKKEPYSVKKDASNLDPVKVQPNSYFVLGDNRALSRDSRTWGAIPRNRIIGKVLMRIWPLAKARTFK